ncbi:MAG TPA: hypothetical protein VG845_09830 [Dehalococcoidia bacterium]|nr:hypothetical protein [Dehalococcoidia bacterium]
MPHERESALEEHHPSDGLLRIEASRHRLPDRLYCAAVHPSAAHLARAAFPRCDRAGQDVSLRDRVGQ